MYFLTHIIKPCPAILRSLRGQANRNAIIRLSVVISHSKGDLLATQKDSAHTPLVDKGTNKGTDMKFSKTHDPQSVSFQLQVQTGGALSIPQINRDTDAPGNKTGYASSSMHSSLVNSRASSKTPLICSECPEIDALNNQDVKSMLLAPPDAASSPVSSRLQIDSSVPTSAIVSEPVFTPSHRRILGCPNTAEKLKLAMDGPDLPQTPTFAAKYDPSNIGSFESLTPEEEYFILNFELQRIEDIIRELKRAILLQKKKCAYPALESLSLDYISMACCTIELSAIYYYKRFFLIGSVHDYDTLYIILACVLLAMKVSGMPRTLECMRPSFFSKLFAHYFKEKPETVESILKQTEEWVYMRLGHDLCTISLLDLLISESSKLFQEAEVSNSNAVNFLIEDEVLQDRSANQTHTDTMDVTDVTDVVDTANNNTRESNLALSDVEKQTIQQPQKHSVTFSDNKADSLSTAEHSSNVHFSAHPVSFAVDADLRVSSLHTIPHQHDGGSPRSKRPLRHVSKSPIFEGHSKIEPSSPSAVAFQNHEFSYSRNLSPQNPVIQQDNHMPTSSTLCSPAKLLAAFDEKQLYIRARQLGHAARYHPFSNATSVANSKVTAFDPDSSSVSTRSTRSGRCHVGERPEFILSVYNGTVSDANMHISDLNVSNCTEAPSNQATTDSAIFKWPRFQAPRQFKFSERQQMIRRARSSGYNCASRCRQCVQRRHHLRPYSIQICCPANAVLGLHGTVFGSLQEHTDSVSPIGRSKGCPHAAKNMPLQASFNPFKTLTSANITETSLGPTTENPLLKMMCREAITIASSRVRHTSDDMLATQSSSQHIPSSKRYYHNPKEELVSIMASFSQENESLIKTKVADGSITSDKQMGLSEDTFSITAKDTALQAPTNQQHAKLIKNLRRKRSKTMQLTFARDSPASSHKLLPDCTLSPQAIQYAVLDQHKQKWIESRSTSITLQDVKKSSKQCSDQPVPTATEDMALVVTATVTHTPGEVDSPYTESKPETPDPVPHDILFNPQNLHQSNEHAATEEILLDAPTPSTNFASWKKPGTPGTKPSVFKESMTPDVNTLMQSPQNMPSKVRRINGRMILAQSKLRCLTKRSMHVRFSPRVASYVVKHLHNNPLHSSSALKISETSSLTSVLTSCEIHTDIFYSNLPSSVSKESLSKVTSWPLIQGLRRVSISAHALNSVSLHQRRCKTRKKLHKSKSFSYYTDIRFGYQPDFIDTDADVSASDASNMQAVGTKVIPASMAPRVPVQQQQQQQQRRGANVTVEAKLSKTRGDKSVPRTLVISHHTSPEQITGIDTPDASDSRVPNSCTLSTISITSSNSEQLRRLNFNIGPTVSISYETRGHTISSTTSRISLFTDLQDTQHKLDTFSHRYEGTGEVCSCGSSSCSHKVPSMMHQTTWKNTTTLHMISTMSAMVHEPTASDDQYIKHLASNRTTTKIKALISMQFTTIVKFILATPPVLAHIAEMCQMALFGEFNTFASSILASQIRNMAHFGSAQERAWAAQLTEDKIAVLAFLFTTSYAYSLCFKYTDMLILFHNSNISVFLLAESLLLLNNRIIPYLEAYVNRDSDADTNATELYSMSPVNLPVVYPTNATASGTKPISVSEFSSGAKAKAKVLPSTLNVPNSAKATATLTTTPKDCASAAEPSIVSPTAVDGTSPNQFPISVLEATSKTVDEPSSLAGQVRTILSQRPRSPITRAELYKSFIGYRDETDLQFTPDIQDMPDVQDTTALQIGTFGFYMGAQQHSVIVMEDAAPKPGHIPATSSCGSFDVNKSTSNSANVSDDLDSILQAVLFVSDTYPSSFIKELKMHQQNVAASLSTLKKKYFSTVYTVLKQPRSSEPICIQQYMTGIRSIFNLIRMHIIPRLDLCQYMIKQPGTAIHDIRHWQKILRLEGDRKEYRRLQSLMGDATPEQKLDIERQLNEISVKWNVTGNSFWEDSDDI